MWSRRKLAGLVVAFALTACADADKENGIGERVDARIIVGGGSDGSISTQHDASTTQHDASSTTQHDAPASGGGTTLSETTGADDGATSIACSDQSTGATLQNSYYRVFALTGAFTVTDVIFGVDSAMGGPQTLTVTVGTYTGTIGGGTLTKADITGKTTATVSVNDGDTSEDVPITATISGKLAVEIDAPSVGAQFYIGANTGGETEPGYLSSAASPNGCGISSPTNADTEAGGSDDILITVAGSY